MKTMAHSIAYKRLRAPREDGESLCDPPLTDESAFLDQNLALRQEADLDLGGCRLSDLQSEARRSLWSTLAPTRRNIATWRGTIWESPRR